MQRSISNFHNLLFFKLAGILCLLFFSPAGILGQCTNRITVATGTQLFACNEVTVTSAGSVDFQSFCGIGPHWAGKDDSGSYTFTFATPVSGVTLDIHKVNNDPGGIEEVEIEINGAPYFPSNAGVLSSCDQFQIAVSPLGRLICPCFGCCFNCAASREALQIDEIINSITIRDLNIAGSPNGVPFTIWFCCGACISNAGVLSSPPLQLCPDILATVPPPTISSTPPGTILQYVLFSDLNDKLGSILSISNIPSFGFDPATMDEGTTYYIAAIAGEELNGNVDLNSPCLDFSNVIEVMWWPWPTVEFSVGDPNICVGECMIVTTTFTGDPPFTLTYSTAATGPITNVFQDLIGTFEICLPLNSSPGSLNLQAISLTDTNCTCN